MKQWQFLDGATAMVAKNEEVYTANACKCHFAHTTGTSSYFGRAIRQGQLYDKVNDVKHSPRISTGCIVKRPLLSKSSWGVSIHTHQSAAPLPLQKSVPSGNYYYWLENQKNPTTILVRNNWKKFSSLFSGCFESHPQGYSGVLVCFCRCIVVTYRAPLLEVASHTCSMQKLWSYQLPKFTS